MKPWIHVPALSTAGIELPAFDVSPMDFVSVQLPGGPCFLTLYRQIEQVVTHPSQYGNDPEIVLRSVSEPVRGSLLVRTVGQYLRKHADPNSPFYNRIYDQPDITPRSYMHTLSSAEQRMLSICCTASRAPYLLLHLVGLDQDSAEQVVNLAEEAIPAGGAVILADHCADFLDKVTRAVHFTVDSNEDIRPVPFQLKRKN